MLVRVTGTCLHVHTYPRLIYQQGSVKLSQVHFSMISAGDAGTELLVVVDVV